MSDAPRPLPPDAHANEAGDRFDVPVYNRAGEIIAYRQPLQALRTSSVERAPRLGLEFRPFRQPISDGAEANLRLLLARVGIVGDGRPDWAWAPLEQGHRHFGIGAEQNRQRTALFDELVDTVLPDEFVGVDVSGRHLHGEGLRVSAFGMSYEIRDRFRFVAFRLDNKNRHIALGAGWTQQSAVDDGRRRWDGEHLERIDATIATPGLLRTLGEHGFGHIGICVSGFLAMLWHEVGEYEDEFWDHHGMALGWW